ncbi:PEPxxWA-CTERM sorting domain-containing protein [Sandaracinobacter sp. RS1-74]|uniref:PEPxxWA-CTERM sorting domain-containing protein n=1 Tax=Sandaracinobacteroides sayramensis TaxID=2913411 RepID=UPI001ED9D823|nr:PEPxxWA-CTERM sorting domain-containing protein [Sandaracinobacteroides sayramensis]MCG2841861.1 PEPxxWA-CTERM sorting domain-containing protein [Sandaracinobacteroides sayramensis]
MAAPAFAAPVDLSDWTQEGGGNWVLSADRNSVEQTWNVVPGVFYGPGNAQGKKLSGTIKVNTSSDDDMIGFVLGYDAGEINAGPGGADFLLIDWKQYDQGGFYGGTAKAGLAISHVTRGLTDDAGAWLHNPDFGVTELARGATLGSTGWVDYQEYSFDLEFTASNVKVYVNGILELDVDGSFTDGAFGFYNYSQQNVIYAGIREDVLPPDPTPGVPEPATWAMLILGFGAVGLSARRRRAVRASN